MKRLLCIILAVMLFPFASAAAEGTNKVDAFVFFGLYVKRMMEYQTIYNADVDLHIEGFNIPSEYGKETRVMTTAGDIIFNTSDYLVKEVRMDVCYSSYGTDKNVQQLIKVLAAMSALEYNELEEKLLKNLYDLNISGGAPSAIQKMSSIFNEGLLDKLLNVLSQKPSKEILVYSGNYDYYADYFKSSSDNVEIVFLNARAK